MSLRVAGAAVLLVLALGPAWAAPELSLDGAASQGGLMIGRTAPGAQVTLDERAIKVGPDGIFVIGFGRDHGPTAVLRVAAAGETLARPLAIAQRSYDIQRIDGLPPTQVTPPEAVLARIRGDAARVRAARDRDSDLTGFARPFVWPVTTGRISGVYGSQRVLNGAARQPHYGIDIAAPTGTPVVAPADGVVGLVEPDLYFSGATLLIDHGHGVSSTFLHLDAIEVTAGQAVRQGERIATVGSSGRSTGPHLDWRINWFERRIDPALVVPPFPGG